MYILHIILYMYCTYNTYHILFAGNRMRIIYILYMYITNMIVLMLKSYPLCLLLMHLSHGPLCCEIRDLIYRIISPYYSMYSLSDYLPLSLPLPPLSLSPSIFSISAFIFHLSFLNKYRFVSSSLLLD